MMELSREEVMMIARKVVGEGGPRVVGHKLCSKSDERLGYLGKHLTLVLELESEGEGRRERRVFVKAYEVDPKKEDYLGKSGIFKREQDFYRVFVEDAKGIAGKPEWCPSYHLSKERMLVLEDLSEGGFRMVEGREGEWALDRVHLETALRTLACMHATSILMEHREGKRLVDLYPLILGKELLYDEKKPEAPSRKWVKWQIQDLVEGVHHLNGYTYDQKQIIRERLEKQVMRIYVLSKPSHKYRNVLTHGDMWRNNLLFRYSEDGVPLECTFVDFQFVRYAPPAHDLMHLLHFAMKKHTREQLQSHLLQLYHRHLLDRLQHFGLDSHHLMPEDELLHSCRELKELALIQCLLSLHYLLGSVTVAADVDTYDKQEVYLAEHRKEYMHRFFQQKPYVDRITDIFHELIDRYILRGQTE